MKKICAYPKYWCWTTDCIDHLRVIDDNLAFKTSEEYDLFYEKEYPLMDKLRHGIKYKKYCFVMI